MIVLLMLESYLWNYGVFAGDYRVFRDDVVFWVTFSSVALMIPVLFVGCPRIVSNVFFLPGRRGKKRFRPLSKMQSCGMCGRSNTAS